MLATNWRGHEHKRVCLLISPGASAAARLRTVMSVGFFASYQLWQLRKFKTRWNCTQVLCRSMIDVEPGEGDRHHALRKPHPNLPFYLQKGAAGAWGTTLPGRDIHASLY